MTSKEGDKDRETFRRIHTDLVDDFDEELELESEDYEPGDVPGKGISQAERAVRRRYFKELFKLQCELIKMQDWIVAKGHKLVIVFEGRDAAGKGGVIKRITQRLNPRVVRVAALPAPTEREKSQWYFQRFISHLPAGGEIVLFDRSWYNRAGVERVMGFCSEHDLEEFFRSVPEFEKMLVRSGIQLVKYWFSISDEEQEFRFMCRTLDPMKQWKLSKMDLESRRRWEAYTKAKEIMFERTNHPDAPWWVVKADDKKRARLNCIHHLLQQVKYQEIPHTPLELPKREHRVDYHRNPVPAEMHVPEVY